MGLIDRLRAIVIPPFQPNYDTSWPYASINGNTYPIGMLNQTLLGKEEKPNPGYPGLVAWAYQNNPVVYACEQVRVQLFAEATFEWRNRRTGATFGNSDLGLLETPWPNGTTGDLLAGMLLDADLGGDAFVVRLNGGLSRLRPDWVTVITDIDPWTPGAAVYAYAYLPGGTASGREPVVFLREQVAQFTPSKDPLSPHRGMPWLTPVLREVAADFGMTEHKASFLRAGATPNLVVSLDPAVSKVAFDQWSEDFRKKHSGARNAYEPLITGGGAKVEVVGKDFQQLDFKLVQGAGETRIAAAAGVPPVIVGLSEGLQAATYSNYSQARRRFADGTMRPLWRNVCASLQTIVRVPGGSMLTIDDSDIAFLQDDMKDRAEIQATNAQAMKTLVDAGFEPKSVVAGVTGNDLSGLSHTGLYSVQLQPPMPEQPEPEPVPDGLDNPDDEASPAEEPADE